MEDFRDHQAPLHWPDGEKPAPSAGIGHNEPPAETELEAFKRRTDEVFADLRQQALQQQVGMAKVKAIVDSPAADGEFAPPLATDFIAQCKQIAKKLEAKKTELKKPLDDRGKVVMNVYKAIVEPMTAEIARLERLLGDYRADLERREQEHLEAERRAQEEAAAKAEEEAAKQARAAADLAQAAQTEAQRETAATAIAQAQETQATAETATRASQDAAKALLKPVHTKGDYGATGYGKTEWKFEITDADKIPRAYCVPDRALIRQFIADWKRQAGPDASPPRIPGLRIFRETNTVVRSA